MTPQDQTERDEARAIVRAAGERVVRVGVSPMNPKVKWAELTCGHTVWRQRKPRIGAITACEKCSEKAV